MKKTMKKSALLSSVAMLIVSAIVLTSATYAWFSASNTAQITNISTSVQTSTGLLISTDNATWGSEINATPYMPTKFVASSTVTGAKFVSGNFENGKLQLEDVTISGQSTATSNYMMFPLYIKGAANDEVTIQPVFEGSDADALAVVKFALIDKTTNAFVGGGVIAGANNDGNTYNGTEETGAIESDTTGAYLSKGTTSSVTEIADGKVTINLASTASQAYTVLMWAEGNDVDCDAEELTATNVKAVINISRPDPNAGA